MPITRAGTRTRGGLAPDPSPFSSTRQPSRDSSTLWGRTGNGPKAGHPHPRPTTAHPAGRHPTHRPPLGGTPETLTHTLARADRLILDDWGFALLGDCEPRDFLQLIDCFGCCV
jgi:hypothetical protein